jgi:hypothetical protein
VVRKELARLKTIQRERALGVVRTAPADTAASTTRKRKAPAGAAKKAARGATKQASARGARRSGR